MSSAPLQSADSLANSAWHDATSLRRLKAALAEAERDTAAATAEAVRLMRQVEEEQHRAAEAERRTRHAEGLRVTTVQRLAQQDAEIGRLGQQQAATAAELSERSAALDEAEGARAVLVRQVAELREGTAIASSLSNIEVDALTAALAAEKHRAARLEKGRAGDAEKLAVLNQQAARLQADLNAEQAAEQCVAASAAAQLQAERDRSAGLASELAAARAKESRGAEAARAAAAAAAAAAEAAAEAETKEDESGRVDGAELAAQRTRADGLAVELVAAKARVMQLTATAAAAPARRPSTLLQQTATVIRPRSRLALVVTAFTAEADGDLTLLAGQTVVLTKAKDSKKWWKGHLQSDPARAGVFPRAAVQEQVGAAQVDPAFSPAAPPAPARDAGPARTSTSEFERCRRALQSAALPSAAPASTVPEAWGADRAEVQIVQGSPVAPGQPMAAKAESPVMLALDAEVGPLAEPTAEHEYPPPAYDGYSNGGDYGSDEDESGGEYEQEEGEEEQILPSDQDIRNYAEQMLDMDLAEHPDLLWIAEEALLAADLPSGWAEHEDAEGNPYYWRTVGPEKVSSKRPHVQRDSLARYVTG